MRLHPKFKLISLQQRQPTGQCRGSPARDEVAGQQQAPGQGVGDGSAFHALDACKTFSAQAPADSRLAGADAGPGLPPMPPVALISFSALPGGFLQPGSSERRRGKCKECTFGRSGNGDDLVLKLKTHQNATKRDGQYLGVQVYRGSRKARTGRFSHKPRLIGKAPVQPCPHRLGWRPSAVKTDEGNAGRDHS